MIPEKDERVKGGKKRMISVEMEDVLAVLQLCKPYIIGIIAALVIGIVIMIACCNSTFHGRNGRTGNQRI